MILIRKKPSSQYLENRSFCLTQSEFEIISNPTLESQITIYDQSGNVRFILQPKDYADLIIYPKSNFDGGRYFIANMKTELNDDTDVQDGIEIKATCASENDNGFTYTTKAFKNWKFKENDVYIFRHSNGALVEMHTNRSGRTLYSGKLDPHVVKSLAIPSVGSPVTHYIVAVFKKLKQEIV